MAEPTKKRKRRHNKAVSALQRFFNFAYSIGAAIVILGALFKILHMEGGNLMLTIGMGTEVLMFVLTAFEKPEREYHWEDVFPVLESGDPDDKPTFMGGNIPLGADVVESVGAVVGEPSGGGTSGGGTSGGGTVVIGGGGVVPAGVTVGNAGETVVATGEVAAAVAQLNAEQQGTTLGHLATGQLSDDDVQSLSESIAKLNSASEQLTRMADLADATQQYLSHMSAISEQMRQLNETTTKLNLAQQTLLQSYSAINDNSANIGANSTGYVEQMEALNRNIGGLNTIYEIQLKSISSQIDSIDRVNRGLKDIRDMYEKSAAESETFSNETEKMARNMKQLNQVYEKMLNAMTVNMYGGAMAAPPIGTTTANNINDNTDTKDFD